MNNKRKTILSILAILLTFILAAAAMYVSYRLGSGQPIIPTAPAGSRACDAQCPSSKNGSLLMSCTPGSDGTLQSLCTRTGRTEPCGGQTWCCPSAGGTWTTDMTACPTTTPTAAPAAAATAQLCQACGGFTFCAAGLFCDIVDGRCKNTDGSTTCWVGAGDTCTVSANAVCVPSEVVACNPDCSTACGQTAKSINTCTNSCGVATTKQCSATNACANALTLEKKVYRNESGNTPGNYSYLTEIFSVARNEIFVYSITIDNGGPVDADNITITDSLTDENQGLLTFVDAHSNCTYNSTNRTVTCTGIDVSAGETGTVAFRVRVGNNAVNGEEIKNVVVASISNGTATAENTLTISTVVGCNQTCTQDTECSTGLICEGTADRCRRPACSTETDCTCPITGGGGTPTGTITASPTLAAGTATPTGTVTASPTLAAGTGSPTVSIPATGEVEVLPETGILDFPGIAAFGGGLLLAVIGILLAL